MSQPRAVHPGQTVMVTRRTLRRHQLFAPDLAIIRQLFLFVLAVCAARYGVLVHVAVLMSTHEHLVLTDTNGRLPEFLRSLHRLVALGTKIIRKWEGAVWDHEPPSVVVLLTPQAIIEAVAYAIANPVAAGLVRSAHEWPGLTTFVEELGRGTWRAERPSIYFDPKNPDWPALVELHRTLPPMITESMSAEQFRSLVAEEVRRLEQLARADVVAKGWAFMGRDRATKVSPYRRARSFEPIRRRNPTFKVGRGQPEAFAAAVHELRAFRAAYREALTRWRAGMRAVCFPAGTWLMRYAHGAHVEAIARAA